MHSDVLFSQETSHYPTTSQGWLGWLKDLRQKKPELGKTVLSEIVAAGIPAYDEAYYADKLDKKPGAVGEGIVQIGCRLAALFGAIALKVCVISVAVTYGAMVALPLACAGFAGCLAVLWAGDGPAKQREEATKQALLADFRTGDLVRAFAENRLKHVHSSLGVDDVTPDMKVCGNASIAENFAQASARYTSGDLDTYFLLNRDDSPLDEIATEAGGILDRENIPAAEAAVRQAKPHRQLIL